MIIYVVVHEMGEYSDYGCWNEGVFKDKEEAIRFITNKGYTVMEGKEYSRPGTNHNSDVYTIEEWEVN